MKTYATNMVNEKITSGNIILLHNLQLLRKHNAEAKHVYWLVFFIAGIVILPRRWARWLKLSVRAVVAKRIFRHYDEDREWPLLQSLR